MKITIASFGKVCQYNLLTDQQTDLSKDALYYSPIKYKNNSIIVVYRPNYITTPDYFKIINPDQSEKIIPIDSEHTHVMIHNKISNELMYISTNKGVLYITDFDSLNFKKKVVLGNHKNHINTLAIKGNNLYAIFHNLGKSDVVIFDMNTYEILKTYKNIGLKCHDIVFINDGFLYLNSEYGRLQYYNEKLNKISVIATFNTYFLKGLLVVNNYIFVGLNSFGNLNVRLTQSAQIAIIDLTTKELLTIKKIASQGIINSINFLDGCGYEHNKVTDFDINT